MIRQAVTTTLTLSASWVAVPTTAKSNRVGVIIHNAGSQVALFAFNVSGSEQFLALDPGATYQNGFSNAVPIFGRAQTGTTTINIAEVGG